MWHSSKRRQHDFPNQPALQAICRQWTSVFPPVHPRRRVETRNRDTAFSITVNCCLQCYWQAKRQPLLDGVCVPIWPSMVAKDSSCTQYHNLAILDGHPCACATCLQRRDAAFARLTIPADCHCDCGPVHRFPAYRHILHNMACSLCYRLRSANFILSPCVDPIQEMELNFLLHGLNIASHGDNTSYDGSANAS
jgi:hypothetical protein